MLVEIHCQVKLQEDEEDSFFCHIGYHFYCHLNEMNEGGKTLERLANIHVQGQQVQRECSVVGLHSRKELSQIEVAE